MYRVTAGIPRVINLLCDRAMTLAFTQQQPTVKKHLLMAAASQILGDDVVEQRLKGQKTLTMAAVFCVTVVIGYWWGSL